MEEAHASLTRRKKTNTIEAAYNDPSLVGGGVQELDKKLHLRLKYCSNPTFKNGSFECGHLQPMDHDGPNCSCGFPVSQFCDHVVPLAELYPILMQHTDLLQRIADYYPTSISRLSQPTNDPLARVFCVESGWIARRDYERCPKNFTLDIVARAGENAFFITPLGDGAPQTCSVLLAESPDEPTGRYRVRLHNGDEYEVENEDRWRVQKIGGHIPINVVSFDDGAEVFKGVSMNYSNTSRTEEIQNIAKHHRRRNELCAMLGMTTGGKAHANALERTVFFEQQRRQLQDHGTTVHAALTVQFNGRLCTVHDAKVTRNEYLRCLDHPEAVKQGGTMGGRNSHSMDPFVENLEAVSTKTRAIYSFLLSLGDAAPMSEESSRALFAAAEELRGTPEWESNAQATGAKFQTVAEAGSKHHNLPPDPTQGSWARIAHGRMHFEGITDNTFRALVLTLAPVASRRAMSLSVKGLRQGRGTDPICSFVQVHLPPTQLLTYCPTHHTLTTLAHSPTYACTHPHHQVDRITNAAKFNSAGEKLHQRKKWRETRMLFDLYPLFTGDSEKTTDVHNVSFFAFAL
jgi:hypothetical protein